MPKIGYIVASDLAAYQAFIPFASLGDYVYDELDHGANNGFYIAQSGSHNQKNFSCGANSIGHQAYQAYIVSGNEADLAASLAYQNHNSDGTLKYVHGIPINPALRNYRGPISNRIWMIYRDKLASVGNSSGQALFTTAQPPNLVTGKWIRLKDHDFLYQVTSSGYSGDFYVEVLSSTTFKLKTESAGTYLPHTETKTVTYSRCIDASKMEGLDVHGVASEPVIITNAPGSQFLFLRSPETDTSFDCEFFGGATHVKVTGEYNPILGTGDILYRGHRGGYLYSYGKYGMEFTHFNYNDDTPIVNIKSGASDWEWTFTRIDGRMGGFAGLMMKNENDPAHPMRNMRVHDNYIHDVGGEGAYVGQTKDNVAGSPATTCEIELYMYNNRFLRTGVEIMQNGQLADGSRIENNVCYLGSLTRMKPFSANQSSGSQIKPRIGTVLVQGNIIIGFDIQGLISQSNRANEVQSTTKPLDFNRNLYRNGRGRWSFMNYPSDNSIPIKLRRIYLDNITLDNQDGRSQSVDDSGAVILTFSTNQKFFLNNVVIGANMDSMPITDGGNASTFNIPSSTRSANIPATGFKNSGTEGWEDLNINHYFKTGAANHPNYPNTDFPFYTTDVLLHKGAFYGVNSNFTGGNEPATNANCYQIFWDNQGFNSQNPNYNGVPYSKLPPDDVRIEWNTFFNELGLGLCDNFPNDLKTYGKIQYAYADNSDPDVPDTSFINNLPMEFTLSPSKDMVITRIGSGNFIRCAITPVDDQGHIGTQQVSPWIKVE
jgi:hypothetical protein